MVSRQSKKRRLKLPLALLLGLAAGLAIALHPSTVQPILHDCLRAIAQMGRWSGVAYILLYNLATLCLLPGSLLSFSGGVLFGLGWGLVYVLIASLLGATVAFWIGRYVAQTWVYQKLGQFPQFRALNAAVGCEGCKIVLLTRLSPLFPFNLLNYAFGVTQVSLKDYMIGSLGILPGTIMYVYAGSLAGDLTVLSPDTPTLAVMPSTLWLGQWGLRLLGLAATVAVTVYTTHLAQKYLAQSGLTNTSNHPLSYHSTKDL